MQTKLSKANSKILIRTIINTKLAKNNKLNRSILSAFLALVAGIAVAVPKGATDYIDMSVPPQHDFYQHANGGWTPNNEQCGVLGEIKQNIKTATDKCLDDIINGRKDSDMSNAITKLYTSLTKPDEDKLKSSISREFDFIDKINKKTKESDIPIVLGHLNSIGVPVFVDVDVKSFKSEGSYIETAFITPGKIPYDITETDIMNLFQMSGLIKINYSIATNLIRIRDLEQKTADSFAKKHASKQQSYSKYIAVPIEETDDTKAWKDLKEVEDYLLTSELSEKRQFVRYAPTYLTLLNQDIFRNIDLEDLKKYLKFRLLYSYRGALFDNNSVSNVAKNKQALQQINDSFSYELPRLCFTSEINRNKAKIDDIVANVKSAYDREIDSVYWMNPETKQLAHKKLADVHVEIAYPPKLKKLDDSELTKDDSVSNLKLINTYHYEQLKINRIGTPPDSLNSWINVPPYGSARHDSKSHAILIPLRYLMPPFFQAYSNNDDAGIQTMNNALNYGSVGFTIAHELSHTLEIDKFSSDPEEIERFNNIAKNLIKQYQFYNHGGPLTVKENIADILGLKMSGDAYKMTLGEKSSPMFNIELPNNKTLSLSGNQLRYYSFAERWRDNDNDCDGNRRTHSTNKDRVNATLMNDDGFQTEFGTEPVDKMYLAPDQRIRIWEKTKN